MPERETISTNVSPEMNSEQIKQLAAKNEWEYVGEGFDNIVYADAQKLKALRFPKRIEGIALIERDAAVLPTLPAQKDIVIPVPEIKSQDGLVYGAYPFVSGKQYEHLSEQERRHALVLLIEFLHRLHTQANPAPPVVPTISCHEHFSAIYAKVQEELANILNEKQIDYAKALFSAYLEQYKLTPTALIHGDISFDHLYYDNDGKLSIIDWNDMQITDPAYEFHHLLRQLPKEERDILRQQYNTSDDESFWKRADAYTKIDTFDALLNFVKEKNTVHIQNFLDRIDTDMLDPVAS